jgi:hypothetical protein
VVPTLEGHPDDGAGRPAPVLVWRFPAPVRCIASTVLGGGIGARSWILNATVTLGYREQDPAAHAGRIAAAAGLERGRGAALLTGVDVRSFRTAEDGGATPSPPSGSAPSPGRRPPTGRTRSGGPAP